MAARDVQNDREFIIPTLEIPDGFLSEGAQAAMSTRNGFIAYGAPKKRSSVPNAPIYLHEVNSRSVLYHPCVRQLVHESYGVFSMLNAKMPKVPEEKRTKEITEYCLTYRSVLLACAQELRQQFSETANEQLLEYEQMLLDIELIWHLIQCLVIDTYLGSRLLYKLLSWLSVHFPEAERMTAELIEEEDNFSDKYWNTITLSILQGNIHCARSLLQMHSKSQKRNFISLDKLLASMPMYGDSSGGSLHEFHMRWRHWREECKLRLEDFEGDPHLEEICMILCGDHKVLTEKSSLCVHWYHVMISFLLYTDPCIGLTALGDIARVYYTHVTENGKKASIVDTIILAVMELDIMSVIQLSCKFNDSWWFPVHMMDLLIQSNIIDRDIENIQNLRRYILKDYADTLMCDESLWQVGLGYLDHCNVQSDILECYMERIPLKQDSTAVKVISFARERRMDNLVKSVANVMTRKMLAHNMLGSALSWVLISKDERFADEIADRWLKSYLKDRKVDNLDVFQEYSTSVLISDKLTFVGKYCDFHKLYSTGDIKEAAALLWTLIDSDLAPPSFQMLMLLDVVPLLESAVPLFSSDQTHLLTQCLENVVEALDGEEYSEDQIELVRLACARNLSRALITAPESSPTIRL